MTTKTYKKTYIEQNVWEAALDRVRQIYDRYDDVSISFSGGKDSTAVMQVALIVAREKNRLPLNVIFYDEEAIFPTTIEYVERVRNHPDINHPDINLIWMCLPIKQRNACSRKQPFWYGWNPKEKDKWVRPMPEYAVSELEGFKIGMNIPEASDLYNRNYKGSKIQLLGLRAQESVRRYRVVAQKLNDNWLSRSGDYNMHKAYPIYDWTTEDVWRAVEIFQWDYNRSYDLLMQCDVSWHNQRACPAFGEEPLKSLYLYAEIWPDIWHKMINRVHGAATAFKYAKTELYSGDIKKPENIATYKEFLSFILGMYVDAKLILANINKAIAEHNKKSILQISEEDADPISGISWKYLCKIATKGDYKGRLTRGMTNLSTSENEAELLENVKKYGTELMKQLKLK